MVILNLTIWEKTFLRIKSVFNFISSEAGKITHRMVKLEAHRYCCAEI